MSSPVHLENEEAHVSISPSSSSTYKHRLLNKSCLTILYFKKETSLTKLTLSQKKKHYLLSLLKIKIKLIDKLHMQKEHFHID